MRFEFPVQQIICHIVCPKSLCHSPVRIGLPDRTEKIELVHEPPDLLGIHDDSHVEKPHINAEDTLLVAAEVVCFQDQFKVGPIIRFLFLTVSL